MRRSEILVFVFGLLLTGGSIANGAGTDLRAETAKLLDGSVKNTPAAIAASRSQYERLKGVYPRERRLDYAFALVLMNQRRYHDAIPLVSGYLESEKGDVGARRLKIFALIMDKRCVEALKEASLLSQCFPAGSDPKREGEYREKAEFLGAVFGYFELARPTVVDAQMRAEVRDRIAGRLGERLTAFDQGRNAVARALADLQQQREAEQKQVAATDGQRRDQVLTVLEKDKKKVGEHEETVQSSEAQLQDAQREINVLQRQLASLQNDRARLAAQITVAQVQLEQVTAAASTAFDRTRAAIARTTQTELIVNGTVAQVNAAAMNLVALNKQAFEMDRKLLALQAQAANASGKGGEEIKSLEKSEAAIRDAEKRAKIAEKQLRKPVPTSNARIAAINAKMTNFATYAPFPYEREKERVLAWFAK